MTIVEALKIAGENGKIVRAKDAECDDKFYLKVTNAYSRIIVFSNGEQIGVRWEPEFNDLIAKDWLVLKKGPIK